MNEALETTYERWPIYLDEPKRKHETSQDSLFPDPDSKTGFLGCWQLYRDFRWQIIVQKSAMVDMNAKANRIKGPNNIAGNWNPMI
jgi:hypothetical protein